MDFKSISLDNVVCTTPELPILEIMKAYDDNHNSRSFTFYPEILGKKEQMCISVTGKYIAGEILNVKEPAKYESFRLSLLNSLHDAINDNHNFNNNKSDRDRINELLSNGKEGTTDFLDEVLNDADKLWSFIKEDRLLYRKFTNSELYLVSLPGSHQRTLHICSFLTLVSGTRVGSVLFPLRIYDNNFHMFLKIFGDEDEVLQLPHTACSEVKIHDELSKGYEPSETKYSRSFVCFDENNKHEFSIPLEYVDTYEVDGVKRDFYLPEGLKLNVFNKEDYDKIIERSLVGTVQSYSRVYAVKQIVREVNFYNVAGQLPVLNSFYLKDSGLHICLTQKNSVPEVILTYKALITNFNISHYRQAFKIKIFNADPCEFYELLKSKKEEFQNLIAYFDLNTPYNKEVVRLNRRVHKHKKGSLPNYVRFQLSTGDTIGFKTKPIKSHLNPQEFILEYVLTKDVKEFQQEVSIGIDTRNCRRILEELSKLTREFDTVK